MQNVSSDKHCACHVCMYVCMYKVYVYFVVRRIDNPYLLLSVKLGEHVHLRSTHVLHTVAVERSRNIKINDRN